MIDELGFATSLYSATGMQAAATTNGGSLNFPPLNCTTGQIGTANGTRNEISSKYNYINVFSKNCLIFI